MKSKILSLFLLTAFLSIAMISAADLTFTQTIDSQIFTSTLTGADTENVSIATKYNDGTIIPTNVDFTSAPEIEVNATVIYENLGIGIHTGSLIISNGTDNETKSVEFIKTFCELGEVGDADEDIGLLELKDIEIDNSDGDDNEWSPLDEITIEVEVENIGDDRVREVIVEIGLFDESGDNIIDDMNELDKEEIELGSINDDDDDTAIFTFTVPADFAEDGTEDYTLVIKAYSDDIDEDTVCTSYSEDLTENYYEVITGEREGDEENHIVVDNVRLSPADPQCGEIVQVSAEVYNIGDSDYEDQIKVTLYNEDLGIELTKTLREDFDQGDSEEIEFEFVVPEDAETATYSLEFRTFYDYDDKDDYYNIQSEKKFFKSLTIDGNCIIIPESSVDISAELDDETPEAKAGNQVIIKTTLENTGDDSTLYTISVYGNSAWSSLEGINPASVIIDAGDSKDVSIILNIDKDVEGDKEFTIKTSHNEEITEQRVALSVSASSTSGITGSAIGDHITENGFIYAIVVINLILIIAIILVIRRMVVSKVPAGL